MRAFNKEFEEYKLTVSGLSSLSEDAFMNWNRNYVNKGISFDPTNFLRGKMYSFEYLDKIEGKKKFINKRPVIFFTGFFSYTDRRAFNGIDIILIPPIYRLAFFTRIWSVYERTIEANIEKIKRGEIQGQIPLKVDYDTVNIVMKDIPFKNAYRIWDLKKIRDIKEIPYEDWTKMIYLHTRSIEGESIEEIYKRNSKI